jgi:hypothetical protein
MEPCTHCKKEIDMTKKGYTKVMLSKGGAKELVDVYLCGQCEKYFPYPVDCFACGLSVPTTDAAIPIVVQRPKDGNKVKIVVCSLKCHKGFSRKIFSQDSDTKSECNYCKKGVRRMKKCSRCKLIRYCSSECQVADWIEHKDACKMYTQATAK